jgi:hypothetical protein
VTFPSHTTILVDLAQLIVDAVPVLSNHVVIGPMVEAPLELCLQVEYGEINIDWDGMEVADHALVVRIGYPWQEGSGFAEAYDYLFDLMRQAYQALKGGVMLGINSEGGIIVSPPFSITPPALGGPQVSGVTNLLWASLTLHGEGKEGLSYVED